MGNRAARRTRHTSVAPISIPEMATAGSLIASTVVARAPRTRVPTLPSDIPARHPSAIATASQPTERAPGTAPDRSGIAGRATPSVVITRLAAISPTATRAAITPRGGNSDAKMIAAITIALVAAVKATIGTSDDLGGWAGRI